MACDCVVSFIALTNQISEDFSYDSRNATIMNPRITGFVNQAITGVKNARRYSQDDTFVMTYFSKSHLSDKKTNY